MTELEAGWQKLIIEARRARVRETAESKPVGPGEDHGVFEYGVDVKANKTTVLPFTSWLPKIDNANAQRLPSVITAEVVVTSPKMPGLELRIPANATIYDHEGKPVRTGKVAQGK